MLEHLNATPVAPKRVVVLGAGGFVGGAVLARLERDGVPVLPLARAQVDLLAAGAEARLAGYLQPDDAFVAVSARAPVKNADMLVENMLMVRTMLRALALRTVAHVVNVSSDAVFADSDAPLNEQSNTAPGSLHGMMHLARELMFRTEVKSPLATVRPTLIYGAGDPHNGYGPNKFRRLAGNGEDIVLYGEGEERRDHVCVDDVAELIARVLFRRSAGSLNIATGEVHSFRAIAEKVVKLSGRNVAIKGSPRSGPMPHNGYRPFDASATRSAFPDFRYIGIDEGLARAQAAAAAEAGHG